MNKTPRDLVILCNMQIGQHKQLNQINFSGNFVKINDLFQIAYRILSFVSGSCIRIQNCGKGFYYYYE